MGEFVSRLGSRQARKYMAVHKLAIILAACGAVGDAPRADVFDLLDRVKGEAVPVRTLTLAHLATDGTGLDRPSEDRIRVVLETRKHSPVCRVFHRLGSPGPQNTGISCEAPKLTRLRLLHPLVRRPAQPLLPDAWNKTLSPSYVRLVVLPKLLQHHALLGAKTKGEEEGHCDTVGRARNPVGNHEGLA